MLISSPKQIPNYIQSKRFGPRPDLKCFFLLQGFSPIWPGLTSGLHFKDPVSQRHLFHRYFSTSSALRIGHRCLYLSQRQLLPRDGNYCPHKIQTSRDPVHSCLFLLPYLSPSPFVSLFSIHTDLLSVLQICEVLCCLGGLCTCCSLCQDCFAELAPPRSELSSNDTTFGS